MTTGFIGKPSPEVQKIIEQASEAEELMVAQIITKKPIGLEKYGLKVREFSLWQFSLMQRIWALGPWAESIQPWLFVWGMCAPLEEIYEALEIAEELKGGKGRAAIGVRLHEWLNRSGIPQTVVQEVLDDASATFKLASKLFPAIDETTATDAKKNEG